MAARSRRTGARRLPPTPTIPGPVVVDAAVLPDLLARVGGASAGRHRRPHCRLRRCPAATAASSLAGGDADAAAAMAKLASRPPMAPVLLVEAIGREPDGPLPCRHAAHAGHLLLRRT
jgi:hypothetical protein